MLFDLVKRFFESVNWMKIQLLLKMQQLFQIRKVRGREDNIVKIDSDPKP